MELNELLSKAKALNEKKKFKEVINLLTEELLTEHNNADLYAEKAEALYKTNKLEKCIFYANKSLQLDPYNAKANNYKGNYEGFNNNFLKAITYFEKAIETSPRYATAYNGLGNAFKNLKKYDNAIYYYNKAIELNPKYDVAYTNLGNAYRELKEIDTAIECYNKAIEINPKFANPFNGLGNTYYQLDNYNKAIEYYNKAIEINPRLPHPHNGLGITYKKLKNTEKAIESFKNAISADESYNFPYYNLAYELFNKKDYDNALFYLKKYKEYTKDPKDYYVEIASSKIDEINELKEHKKSIINAIVEVVRKIKDLLLYKGDSVTHYTSLKTAKELIIKTSSFRLSEGNFLNDTSEGRELLDFLNFHPILNKYNSNTTIRFAEKPFIGSFVSETKTNDLALWRMYGKEGKDEACGCAITIDRDEFIHGILHTLTDGISDEIASEDSEEFNFYRVAYRAFDIHSNTKFIIPEAKEDEDELNTLINDLQQLITDFNSETKHGTKDYEQVLDQLNNIAYLFKSAEYQYEHEIRLVVKGIGFKKNMILDDSIPKVYIELDAIIPAIAQIILGPKVSSSDEWASTFYYALEKEGFYPEILISHLPYK